MPRRRWIQIEGKLYEVGVDELPQGDGETQQGPTVFGDNVEFVSPIDGTVVRGRAAMRDHCARHNVVPNQELAGLKPRTFGNAPTVSPKERENIKRTMYQIADHRGYFTQKG
jgi:hypothetical protein